MWMIMEKFVEELKTAVVFKDDTGIGDIVLVAIDTPRSLLYARVKDFEWDNSRRDEWWHVTLQLLSVPPQEVKWTLRREQFTGREIFTMGGDKRFMKAVDLDRSGPALPAGKKQKKAGPKLKLVD